MHYPFKVMFSPQSYCDYLLSVAEESTHPDSFRLHDRQRPALSRSERGSGILPFRYARGRRRQLRNFVPEIKEMKKALGSFEVIRFKQTRQRLCPSTDKRLL